MTETPPLPPFSLVNSEEIKLVRDKFKDQVIFKDLAELVKEDELAKTELNQQLDAHLQRLIMSNLKSAFKNIGREKDFLKFIFELVQLESGEEQIQMIDEVLGAADDLFWESIETQLRDDLLTDLLEKLREAS